MHAISDIFGLTQNIFRDDESVTNKKPLFTKLPFEDSVMPGVISLSKL